MGRRENCHKICFRHGQVKGSYVLIVDGTAQVLQHHMHRCCPL